MYYYVFYLAALLSRDFDQNYLGHNMAVAVCMLNYLDSKLVQC